MQVQPIVSPIEFFYKINQHFLTMVHDVELENGEYESIIDLLKLDKLEDEES
jgi:hypothetical protein